MIKTIIVTTGILSGCFLTGCNSASSEGAPNNMVPSTITTSRGVVAPSITGGGGVTTSQTITYVPAPVTQVVTVVEKRDGQGNLIETTTTTTTTTYGTPPVPEGPAEVKGPSGGSVQDHQGTDMTPSAFNTQGTVMPNNVYYGTTTQTYQGSYYTGYLSLNPTATGQFVATNVHKGIY